MNVPFHDMTAREQNETRAEWAHEALRAFDERSSQNYFGKPASDTTNDVLMETGGDLVCALMHLARLIGADPSALLEKGRNDFDSDVREESQ
ncbi:hypothetical protein FE633_17545 [Streptomyces montanus]|uniref:Uncharacterized protein n=1 Tax=Streptomyces montanus TaxID=2580423 RepID=A0A5R9FS74_9ACTN|nr:hypothetical protein [Streptomyces montanus]TLS44946.1 hypothetical protein FE633_17545 [Streptomyces montanus]